MCSGSTDDQIRPPWRVQYDESHDLTTLDGFLITYRQRCYITVRSTLSDLRKQIVATQLLSQLPAIPGEQCIQLVAPHMH